MNTWDLSGALVRIGEKYFDYAKKANKCFLLGMLDMVEVYESYMKGIYDAVKCLGGFRICYHKTKLGYYDKIFITYHDEPIGVPWIIEVE